MITVPARRVKQFGVEFYQAGLSAKDIDRLVKFEVLGYSGAETNDDGKGKTRKAATARSRVNWDSLEKRISESENAYQRPIIRRKIDELAAYYRECKDAATLPAIPGAVIITPAAMIIPQSTMVALKRSLTPTGSVLISSEVVSTSANRNSSHESKKHRMAVAANPGNDTGRTTRMSAPRREHPSILAASSSATGTLWK